MTGTKKTFMCSAQAKNYKSNLKKKKKKKKKPSLLAAPHEIDDQNRQQLMIWQ